jgi:hypothetical protein
MPTRVAFPGLALHRRAAAAPILSASAKINGVAPLDPT